MLRYDCRETYCLNSGVQLIMSTVMNTNFLKDGAFLQSSEGRFFIFSELLGSYCSWNSNLQEIIKKQAILFKPPFWGFLEESPSAPQYFVYKNVQCLNQNQFIDFLNSIALNNSKKESIHWDHSEKAAFDEQFHWIQDKISQGHLEKALPITLQQGAGQISQGFLKDTLLMLVEKTKSNFIYGFWTDEKGMIGATPEVLMSWKQDSVRLSTMALAGTWKKKGGFVPDFKDPKILQEHHFVVDDILTQLSDLKLIQHEEISVVELPYLYHLKTDLAFQCRSFLEAKKALAQLHPTAALGIYPRSKAIFQDLSDFKLQKIRQDFGSPFGVLSENEIFSLVAIRNLLWNKKLNHHDIYLFAGCGVTQNSQLDMEWQEVLDKQDSVKKMLGLNSL